MINNYDNDANYISIIVWNKNNTNMLTPESLSSAYKLEQLFHEYILTDDNNHQYQYENFCSTNYISSPVMYSNILHFILFLIDLYTLIICKNK